MEIGAKILRVKSCSSTNDLAKELALTGEKEGTAVISDEQTKGKGTKGRVWYSPRKKGLYVSIILHPPHSDISLLPLVAGLAVSEAIFESIGIGIRLRWPNDIIWGKKKLAGILCESGFLGNRVNYVILGIGLNVNHGREDFPEEIRSFATSLKLITKKDMDAEIILGNLWRALNFWYSQFSQGRKGKIVSAFREKLILSLGKKIIVITGEKEFSGFFRGINSQGGLVLESQGKRRSFFSAEIKTIKNEKKEG